MTTTEIVSIVALVVFGGLFLWAAYLSYQKSWKAGAYISLTVGALFLVVAVPPTRDFLRTTAWAAFVTSLEATGQGLLRLSKTIDDIRAGMELEQKKRESQQKELEQVQTQIKDMQASLRSSQEALDIQQKKLADVDQILKSFYEASTTDTVDTKKDSDRLVIIGHDETHVSIYVVLPRPPIPQTLQLQWHVYAQPRNSYYVQENLVVFRWGQSESSFREHNLSLSYVPDPTKTAVERHLVRRGDRALLDGRVQMYPFGQFDPVIRALAAKRPNATISGEEIEAALQAEVNTLPPVGASH